MCVKEAFSYFWERFLLGDFLSYLARFCSSVTFMAFMVRVLPERVLLVVVAPCHWKLVHWHGWPFVVLSSEMGWGLRLQGSLFEIPPPLSWIALVLVVFDMVMDCFP